jgi:hypothetical protein
MVGPNATVKLITPDNPSPTAPNTPGVGGCPIIQLFGACLFSYMVVDPWWNPPAQNGIGDGCKSGGSSSNVTVSAGGTSGVRMTYPAGDTFQVLVSDVQVPEPGVTPVIFATAIGWFAAADCKFTNSPRPPPDNFQVDLGLPEVVGWYY